MARVVRSATCVLKLLQQSGYRRLMQAVRTLGLLLLLVAMLIVPAHNGMASDNSATMMERADGSPCPPQDCGSMPDCTMALPGGTGHFLCLLPDGSSSQRFDVSSVAFDLSNVTARALFDGDGLRRPPKI